MEHSEAVELMATERYLLGELPSEQKEAFEEHLFGCPECALDVRAGAAFVQEAKLQLPGFVAPAPAPAKPRPEPKQRSWFSWWRPAFAVPAFALLLIIVGYQNLATIPGLRHAATEPRVLPWATLHAGTRGAAHTQLVADRSHGVVLLIDLPQQGEYPSFAFGFEDPQGKRLWTQTVSSSADGAPISLVIPGTGLQQGSYTLSITGITSQGGRTELDRRILDIRFNE